ncbi:Hypothetical predicted protein [Mytilus galloprovincialis]|uniref:Zinc finger PHD-type domain-containing protein n=1 Tax=Mytilus galloprovincialis TaxID=29158 RepID=A0A8B6GDW7_MYTGA|nr:Hypothetical predicted protein [Mytilus galloprovincialis]
MSIENPPKAIVYPNEPRNRKDSIDHYINPVCELAVTDSESIECNACDMWLHKYCTILSDEHFEKHTTDIDMLYTCHLCTLRDQDDCVTTIQEEYHRSLVYFDLVLTRDNKESSAAGVNQSCDQNLTKAKTKRYAKVLYQPQKTRNQYLYSQQNSCQYANQAVFFKNPILSSRQPYKTNQYFQPKQHIPVPSDKKYVQNNKRQNFNKPIVRHDIAGQSPMPEKCHNVDNEAMCNTTVPTNSDT